MAVREIELRVARLEAEVAKLKEQAASAVASKGDWLIDIFGAFDNDPIYEEAMRLGREYRESLRPKTARKSARKASKKSAEGRQE